MCHSVKLILVCALACINVSDISKYDRAGAEEKPSGKTEQDALIKAEQPAASICG